MADGGRRPRAAARKAEAGARPAAALARLKRAVGRRGWLAPPDDLERYTTDWRRLWLGATPLVLRPATTGEVAEIVAICAEEGLAVVPQAGNTGLVGGGVPRRGGREVVVSLERMTAIRDLDPVGATVTVEAGCILADVQAAAAAAGLLYPLSLAAEGSCRIGGNLATNAGGTNVLRYGNARDHVLGLEVVLADGQVWDGLRALRKDNSGYDLKQLFLGSEGTLGIVTAAVLKLWPRPRAKVTAWLGVAGAGEALALLARCQRAVGGQVTACEYMAAEALELLFARLPGHRPPLAGRPGAAMGGCLLLEATSGREGDGLDGAIEEALAAAMAAGEAEDAVIARSEGQAQALWRIREDMPQAQALAGGGLKHDVALPLARLPDFLAQARSRVLALVPQARIFAFGHLGDGNIHFNQCADDPAALEALLAREREIADAVEALAVEMGGSFSAEHGIGQLRLRQMARYKPPLELALMRKLKAALDPEGRLNPGKVVA